MKTKASIDIAIIGAMTEEVDALLAHMTDCVKDTFQQMVYHIGWCHNRRIMVLQSGIGKVSAAMATMFILEHFTPHCIINIGSDGGMGKTLQVGDVVIASAVAYHDVDVTLIGFEYGQVPGMPASFLADKQLVELAQQCVKSTAANHVVQGLICSGDSFMSAESAIARLRKHFPSVLAVDMEAAAIGHVCTAYQCPFVVIRAISDLVDQPDNKVDFFTFLAKAAKSSAEIVATMVKNYSAQ